MGFIKAFAGAIGGTFADQWKDYLVPMQKHYQQQSRNIQQYHKELMQEEDRIQKGSNNIISNGSKILVPEGMALITMQDGSITGCITEAGGFIFSTEDPNSKSIFAGDGIVSSLISQSWERFKYGGIPAANQTAYYVNLKEIPNNRFGTQSEIYWDDAYLGAQVGAVTRGTYTLKNN